MKFYDYRHFSLDRFRADFSINIRIKHRLVLVQFWIQNKIYLLERGREEREENWRAFVNEDYNTKTLFFAEPHSFVAHSVSMQNVNGASSSEKRTQAAES